MFDQVEGYRSAGRDNLQGQPRLATDTRSRSTEQLLVLSSGQEPGDTSHVRCQTNGLDARNLRCGKDKGGQLRHRNTVATISHFDYHQDVTGDSFGQSNLTQGPVSYTHL